MSEAVVDAPTAFERVQAFVAGIDVPVVAMRSDPEHPLHIADLRVLLDHLVQQQTELEQAQEVDDTVLVEANAALQQVARIEELLEELAAGEIDLASLGDFVTHVREVLAAGGSEYPEELLAPLMAEGLTREQANRALARLDAAVESGAATGGVALDELVDVAGPTGATDEDDGPVFHVSTDKGRMTLRPKVNPNPHVPDVDLSHILGQRDHRGRFDDGGVEG